MIRYTFISKFDEETQLFEGTYKGYRWTARFGEYLLTLTYRDAENTFLEGSAWPFSERTRKAIIEEWLLCQ
jgi:hypothetical protein